MSRNCSNQKPNLLNSKWELKKNTNRQREHMANRVRSYFPKVSHSAIQTELKVNLQEIKTQDTFSLTITFQ